MGVHTHSAPLNAHYFMILLLPPTNQPPISFILDRHYNNVAEIMSSICDWAHLGLCLKPQGPASLIKCMEDGCNCVLHHMCQCTWESEDEEVRQAHGTRKYCAHHHPAVAKGQYHAETGSPSNVLQGFSQSTIETMSTITTATSLPPMGNINITDQSLPADGQEIVFNHQEDHWKRKCGSISSNSSKPHLKSPHQVSSSAASKNFFCTSINHPFLLV